MIFTFNLLLIDWDYLFYSLKLRVDHFIEMNFIFKNVSSVGKLYGSVLKMNAIQKLS